MIEAVVFDLGKVLLDFDYSIAARKLASGGKMSFPEVSQFLAQSPLLFRYETGLLSTADFASQICSETGYSGSAEDFSVCFADIFTEIPPMVALQARLRSKGLPTYIFSNTNELAVRHIRKAYPFFAGFDGYVLSYEHGAMKPDPALYAVVEKVTGRAGRNLLYLDDRPENIATGMKRGWTTILQEAPEKTLQCIEELGL